jgi:1-acyl-sn-glycerol-3-phosphate acyltransferase
MTPNFLYRFLKVYCTLGCRFYFRSWQINNVKAIPASGPVIFIPNHQNAFLDAILMICSSPRNPWSIARASVFKEGFVTKLLTAVQIKPVFRIRDGWSSLRNNDALIQQWSDMLSKGQDILIFAEGNHNEPYAAGVLQKGFARMTLQFQQKNSTPLTIIPVGFHYDDHHAFRSRVLVNFGDAIRVNDVIKPEVSERENIDALLSITDEALKRLSMGIPADEEYSSKFNFLIEHRNVQKTMLEQLKSDKHVLSSYPKAPDVSVQKKSSHNLKYFNPIIWIGYILHFLPYSLISGFIKRKVKDPQFISSLKYALGIFLVPFYYIILTAIFYGIFPNIAALIGFMVLLPLSGILTVDLLKRN